MLNDSLEIFMDEFTPYVVTFEDALQNLEKVLKRCIEAHLSLSTKKFHMMMNEGIVLGHFISFLRIQVGPSKVQVIQTLPIPKTQTDKAFDELKNQLSTAPILRGPDWAFPFHISSDASDKVIGAVLGQEENNLPYAIYFITIKYLMNKFVTNARVIRWLLLLQEFDITIVDKPGKENVVVDFLSRIKTNDNSLVDDSFPDEYLFTVYAHSPWYADIANYLVAGKLPSHLSHREKRKIIQQSARYSWISGCLFHTGLDQEIRRCIREDEVYDILKACHDGPCGGHFTDKRIAHKVLRMGNYWPSLFKDAKKYVRACDSCQRMGQPNHRDEMLLNPQVILEPFERWALDFIGPIDPPSNQRVYILVCTDYMTKWVEAKALIRANEESILDFLFE
eukprot:PITA_27085